VGFGGEARFFRGVASPFVGFGGVRGGLTERERFGSIPNDERFIGSKVVERFIGSKVWGKVGGKVVGVGEVGGFKRFIDKRWAGPMDGSMV
jgi:hypothetical protein